MTDLFIGGRSSGYEVLPGDRHGGYWEEYPPPSGDAWVVRFRGAGVFWVRRSPSHLQVAAGKIGTLYGQSARLESPAGGADGRNPGSPKINISNPAAGGILRFTFFGAIIIRYDAENPCQIARQGLQFYTVL